MMDALAKGKATDVSAKIRLEVNDGYGVLDVPSQEALAPGVTGYRVAGHGDEEGTTWAFLGPGRSRKTDPAPVSRYDLWRARPAASYRWSSG